MSLKWGDELFGQPVTPESWYPDGIVDPGWGWEQLDRDVHMNPGTVQPIFPPKGWANQWDDELWAALANLEGNGRRLSHGMSIYGPGESEGRLLMHGGMVDCVKISTIPFAVLPVSEAPNWIRDLQNALVLARRMGWVD